MEVEYVDVVELLFKDLSSFYALPEEGGAVPRDGILDLARQLTVGLGDQGQVQQVPRHSSVSAMPELAGYDLH